MTQVAIPQIGEVPPQIGGAPAPANYGIPQGARPAAGFAGLNPQESLAEGIGASYGVIGYKGKIFSLRYRGQNHIFTRKDDGTPSSYIDVIVLRAAKVKAKSYYSGGFEENASAGKRPDCHSLDGIRPDVDVAAKQADVCALCPRNVFKTDQNGRKSRECSDYKRIAVLLLPHQTLPFFGQPLLEPVFLRIPPASLQGLGTFGDTLATQGWPYPSFITRIGFDPMKAHPEFTFKFMQALSDAEAPTIMALVNDSLARRITGEDEIEHRAALGSPTQWGVNNIGAQARMDAGLAPGPATAAVTVNPLSAPTTQQEAGALARQEATRSASLPSTVDLTQGTGGTFSMAPPPEENAPPIQPGAAIGQTADDVGAAVEDADLDARIKALMG